MLIWEAPSVKAGPDSGSWQVTHGGNVPSRPRAGEPLVFNVEKIVGLKNPFAMGITVGRVETNDVVVDDASVSRFHAWFQHDDKAATWFVTDAESKNGTFVDGARLDPKKRTKLKDGGTVRFGEASMRFMLPESFEAWLKTLSDRVS